MNLGTRYLGLALRNPLVPSASPLSESLDSIRYMEDAGAAAIVMHSLFEEQLTRESHRLDHYLDYGSESFAEALSYFPDAGSYQVGPDAYLEHIRKAAETCEIPIIGSLNGISAGGWTAYGRRIEEAGAAAIELNIYYIPTDPNKPGTEVEDQYVEVVSAVRKAVGIPLAVKIGPFFSSVANMTRKLADAGADGLVLFNRFYQPDIDIDTLEVTPHLVLSNSDELRLPLRWIAILSGRVDVDFAITGGIHSHQDILKSLMAGANATMMASELLRNGIIRITEILEELQRWLEDHEYESVEQMRGSMSQLHVTEPSAFERANYMKVLQSWRPDPAGQAL